MKVIGIIIAALFIAAVTLMLLVGLGISTGKIYVASPETKVLYEGVVCLIERTSSSYLGRSQITVTFDDGYQFYSGSYFNYVIYGDTYIGGHCKIILSNKQSTGDFAVANLYFSR